LKEWRFVLPINLYKTEMIAEAGGGGGEGGGGGYG
jgi:hypothetical protein